MPVLYTITPPNARKIKCVDFNGFYDQLEYIKDVARDNLYNAVKRVRHRDDWWGTRTLNQTIEGMKYGFQDDTNYFLNNIAEVKNNDGTSEGVKMSVEGSAYDMGAVIEGVPECCLNFNLPAPVPYINIMVDLFFSGSFSATQIRNRGIAITNLVNTLLFNGYAVDLHAFEFNSQWDQNVMYTIKIDTKNLSMADLAFLCSPEYFRKIALLTIDKRRDSASSAGMGSSEVLPFMLKKFKKSKVFFIGGSISDKNIGSQLSSVKQANKYITKIFQKYCDENKIVITFNGENEK